MPPATSVAKSTAAIAWRATGVRPIMTSLIVSTQGALRATVSSMRFVEAKAIEQIDVQSLHRVRDQIGDAAHAADHPDAQLLSRIWGSASCPEFRMERRGLS